MEQLIEIFAIEVWIPELGIKIKKDCQKVFLMEDTNRLKQLIRAKTKHANAEVFLRYKKLTP